HLASFEQDDDGVSATFADGEQVRADLLIAADGLRSGVRQTLLPDIKPLYAGYIAWRGLVEEADLSERTRKELFPYFAFGLPPREQMMAYPVAGQNNSIAPGKRLINFAWLQPAVESSTLRETVTDDADKA